MKCLNSFLTACCFHSGTFFATVTTGMTFSSLKIQLWNFSLYQLKFDNVQESAHLQLHPHPFVDVTELHLYSLCVQKHKLKIILSAFIVFQSMYKTRCGIISQSYIISTFRGMIAFLQIYESLKSCRKPSAVRDCGGHTPCVITCRGLACPETLVLARALVTVSRPVLASALLPGTSSSCRKGRWSPPPTAFVCLGTS